MRRSGVADRWLVWWDRLRTGLWPVPLAMVAAAFLLRWAAGWLDVHVEREALEWTWWLNSGSADDARILLSTLVTAIITMSSIVFSITIVTLALAANQFGSRIVRTYMSDLPSKLSLGLLVMTIVYMLLGLRSVHGQMTQAQVPHVTITIGLVLGVACVLVLVVFLHTVARSIVADEVIRRVAAEFEQGIAQLPPGPKPRSALPRTTGNAPPAVVRSVAEGYVQAIHLAAGRCSDVT